MPTDHLHNISIPKFVYRTTRERAQSACTTRLTIHGYSFVRPPTLFTFGPGGLRAPPMVADKAKLAIVFTYFFLLLSFSFSFFSAFYFSPTSGNLPCVKFCFPQYFGITRRYRLFYFILRRKTDFRHFFFLLRPAFGHSRKSLEYSVCFVNAICIF